MPDFQSPEIGALIDAALAEDIGHGDLTSRLAVPAAARGDFAMNARQPLTVAGLPLVALVFARIVPEAKVELLVADGARVAPGTALARATGPARGLLTAERTALNFLQFLSGIATYARRFVDAIAGTGATMVDTRKTVPGYRALSKYATRLGGVRNHRLRLDDGVLIKDNHIAVAGSLRAAVENARLGTPLLTKIEVECDTLEQVQEALAARADMILLDNMKPETLREAVRLAAGRVPLEASGGVRLETVRAIAETGVDFISSGRITQDAPSADIGFDVRIAV
jgi:nicotinate-nucleotide pyrophosphorylase (carboxylating)